MKWTGARLARYALEQLGIRYTFGIPGVHNTELYDELASSETVRPILVTHEGGGSFMADAVSRTSNTVGTLLIVPAAGATHAASGIAEAFLDGIPMLIISGGIRTDTGHRYQLHEIDQMELVKAFTKARFRITRHADIIPTIFEAYRIATDGEPGPVFVEIPVNLQLFTADVGELPKYVAQEQTKPLDDTAIRQAVELLMSAQRPGLFLGWGARDALPQTTAIADRLGAPVATSLQGLSVFPANHPLHTGMGFSNAAVPAATNAFEGCDCLLAVGVRFGEIATGSYGIRQPDKLIHIDINPEVFNANYPADVAIEGDAARVLQAILNTMPEQDDNEDRRMITYHTQGLIARDKQKYQKEWLRHKSRGRVNPARLFQALREQLDDDAYLISDDGNHTFLTAELFPVLKPRHFISPTDFNCMGYCVPAVIGTKLSHPDSQVVGIVGDGAFLMTCMEILTATELGLGVVYYVFNDGELSQISQAQELPYNRKACSVLPAMRIQGVAEATGAVYLPMTSNSDVEPVIERALQEAAAGRPVIVDVHIDYSKKTRFTKGILGTNLSRFPLGMKARMVGRAVARKVKGPPEPADVLE